MTVSHKSEHQGTEEAAWDAGCEDYHKVVVFEVPDDPHQLRDVLASELGVRTTEAQIQVHGLPGVLPVELPRHRAAHVASAIRDLGVGATALPATEIPQLGRCRTVHHVRCEEDRFVIMNLRGQVDSFLRWNQIDAISVGLVPRSTQQQAAPIPTLAVPLGSPHEGNNRSKVTRDNLELLIVADGQTRMLRIDHAKENYEYLGSRISTSANVNFRRLVQDMVAKARHAVLTPATRSFLDHGLSRHYQFRSFAEMQRYTAFHLLLGKSLCALRAASGGASEPMAL